VKTTVLKPSHVDQGILSDLGCTCYLVTLASSNNAVVSNSTAV